MSNQEVCQICKTSNFKYTCPKCNILYCSVKCYNSENHNNCSEDFYKKCVQEEFSLRSAENSESDDFKKMYEILQRMNNETDEMEDIMEEDEDGEENDSDDELSCNDIASRLEGIDINDPNKIWEHLSDKEKEEFHKLVENGEIVNMIPEFKPWWIQNKPKLIEEISESVKEDDTTSTPQIQKDIPAFATLTTKQPAPCLHHNLYNILAAYTCTVRYFNGEHQITPLDASSYLILLSSNLKTNTNFGDFESASKSVIEEGQANNLDMTEEDYEIIRDDVKCIVNGKHGTLKLSALSDIYSLLKLAKEQKFTSGKVYENNDKKEFSKKFGCVKTNELTKTQFNQLIKKIEFFLSFVKNDTVEN